MTQIAIKVTTEEQQLTRNISVRELGTVTLLNSLKYALPKSMRYR